MSKVSRRGLFGGVAAGTMAAALPIAGKSEVKVHTAKVWDVARPYPFNDLPITQLHWDDCLRIYDGWEANIAMLRTDLKQAREANKHLRTVFGAACNRLKISPQDIQFADDVEVALDNLLKGK